MTSKSSLSYLAPIVLPLLLFMINPSCSLMTKQDSAGNEQPPRWRDVGGSVPAEIAEEISRISGDLPSQPSPHPKPNTMNDKGAEVASTTDQADQGQRKPTSHSGGKTESYQVKPGDTLMKIAFEKYGNLYRWREIFDANRNKLTHFNRLVPGTTLTIEGVEYVVIEKNGSPYLIKKHDTLAKISGQVYGDPNFWRDLWHNNRQLIHDPNKIYYGFTLYYQPFENLQKMKNRGPAGKR